MTDLRGFHERPGSGRRPGEDRLGRVLRDVMEGRGSPASGAVAGAGIAPRAFVAAVESPGRRRGPGERPRLGAIAVTAVLCLLGAIALGLWPVLANHRPAGRTSAGGPAIPAAAVQTGGPVAGDQAAPAVHAAPAGSTGTAGVTASTPRGPVATLPLVTPAPAAPQPPPAAASTAAIASPPAACA